jgi:hypothetical protein
LIKQLTLLGPQTLVRLLERILEMRDALLIISPKMNLLGLP